VFTQVNRPFEFDAPDGDVLPAKPPDRVSGTTGRRRAVGMNGTGTRRESVTCRCRIFHLPPAAVAGDKAGSLEVLQGVAR